MPIGIIQITKATNTTKNVYMTSTQWTGLFCDQLGINSTYNMTVPFSSKQSYADLEGPTYTNGQGIQFSLDTLDAISDFANKTQQVMVNLYLDYSDLTDEDDDTYGYACSVIISKDTSPVANTTTVST